nr:flavin-dependent monooxygenase [Euura sp. 'Pontania]
MSRAEKKLRVCVIGAGAAGLCALRHLAGDPSTFEPTTFEQTDHLGGTWVYNESVGIDAKNQLPVHSSMYENLRTNLPSEIMNFPDWRRMGGGARSCITHGQVLSYLQDYADHFQLRRNITFNTRIELVRPDGQAGPVAPLASSTPGRTIWKVSIKNMLTQSTEEREFDAVICCNGHFFEPYIPSIPGIKTFRGQVMHSHDYRKPQPFAGKTVVILGASSSGADIGIELTDYASRVYLSHNTPRIASTLPSNMTETVGVVGVEGDRILLRDGTSVTADVFIYCTGYNYSFPFLGPSCRITVEENYIHPIYRHLLNVEYPTMCFIGIPSSIVPFPMFHIQVQYFIAVLKGVVSLPSREIMLEDAAYKTSLKRHAHRLAEDQWDYNDSLAREGHFEPLPHMYKAGHSAWKVQRSRNLLHYKEAKFLVAEDGESVQIIPHDPKTND